MFLPMQSTKMYIELCADSPHFSHMFDGETGDSHNGAGLKAKAARWRSNTEFVTGGAIFVPGKDAQVRTRKRLPDIEEV